MLALKEALLLKEAKPLVFQQRAEIVSDSNKQRVVTMPTAGYK